MRQRCMVLAPALLLAWAAWTVSPPPVPTAVADTEFSAAAAAEQLRAFAQAPRPVGSPEHARAREWLTHRLRALGFDPLTHEARACAQWTGTTRCARLHNVHARLRGTGSGATVLLAAHYDSVAQGPGAGDDGSGVAILLEVARVLRRSPALVNDVLLLFTDGEEVGLLGAQAFLRDSPERASVGAAINVEARGSTGPSIMFESSTGNAALIAALAAAAAHPVASSLVETLSRVLPNGTDAIEFRAAGIPTLGFAFSGSVQNYHRRTDTADNVDTRSLHHQGSQALALVRLLGNTDLLALHTDRDAVYFDLPGGLLVHYPLGAAHVLALLALVCHALVVARALRRREATVRGMLAGWGALGSSTLVAVLAVAGARMGMHALDPPRVGMAHAALLHAAYGGLALLCALAVWQRVARKADVTALHLGALGGFAVVVVVLAWVAPAAGYLFQAALVCGSLATWVSARARTETVRAAAWCVLPAPALVLLGRALPLALDMQQAQAPEVLAVLLAWTVAALLPAVLPSVTRRVRRGGAGVVAVLCLAGVVVTLWDSTAPRSNTLVRAVRVGEGGSRWVSWDEELTPWVASFMRDDAQHGKLPWLSPWPEPLHHARAPALDVVPPQLSVEADEEAQGRRRVRVRARSPRGGRCMQAWSGEGDRMELLTVDGLAVRPLSRYPAGLERRLWRWFIGPLPDVEVNVRYCAVPAEGFVLALELEPGAHPVLHVSDDTDGLPGAAPRPEPWGPGDPGDVLRVATALRL